MKAKVFFTLISFLLPWTGNLQAQIKPTVEIVDFGKINESEGPKTVRIYVTNQGQGNAALLKVRPTCGCTAANFDKEEFAPGDSAWVELTYDPHRRPGRFEKGVKIYPVEGEMIRVPITGVVFSSPETIQSMFPVDAGLLHLSEKTLMTLSPLDIDKRNLYMDAYNSGQDPVWIKLKSPSEAIETQPFPSPLMPGDKGLIGIYIDPLRITESGPLEYKLELYTSLSPDSIDEPEPFEIILYTEKQH